MFFQLLTKLKISWKIWLPPLFILIIATIYRYVKITTLPGGLFPDEAANGLDINSILNGQLQPFYERGNGREALFFYMLIPAVLLFGRTPFAHHLTSATVGVAVTVLTYFLVKRWFGQRPAFVAAFLAAVSSWYVTLSRTAFRANIAPLLTILFFYFATRVVQSKTRKDYWISSILAGISFGGGFYTYISYRMMIPLVGIVAVFLLIHDLREQPRFQLWKKYWKAMVVSAISALAALVPLILYFVAHPEWLAGRTGQVSIFSPDLNNGNLIGTFLEVFKDTVLGYLTVGDINWRHNVSGFAFVSPIIVSFFVLGLILVTTQALLFIVNYLRRSKNLQDLQLNLKRLPLFILFLWFSLMLAPELLTAEGIPHGLRLIGTIPPVFIISALFIEEIIGRFTHYGVSNKKRRVWATSLLALLLAAEAAFGAWAYFGIAANAPGYAKAFSSDLTVLSNYINERNKPDQTYFVSEHFWDQSVAYQTTALGKPYKVIEQESLNTDKSRVKILNSSQSGLELKSGDQVIFNRDSQYKISDFERIYPQARLKERVQDRFGIVILFIYEIQ